MENDRMMLMAGVDPATEAALRSSLPDVQIAPLNVAPTREELRGARAAVAVVSISGDVDACFRLVSTLAAEGTRVVVVGPSKDADLILRAMREGAREYLSVTDTDKLVSAIRDQIRPQRVSGLGSVIAVVSAKGGAGATTIATNLAGSLARQGDRVCLLDLDFAMGDALAFLDLAGGSAISDVIANIRRLDRQLLDSSLLHHSTGLHVLSQTEKVSDAPRIEPAGLTSLIQFLRQHYKAIILDGLKTFDDHVVSVLDICDRVLLVVTQEVPAVRRAQRCVSFLRRLGIEDGNIQLVVNRYSKTSEIRKELVAETAGLPVSATVANDYPALIRAINHGKLIIESNPGSQVAKDIQALDALVGLAAAEKPRRSLLTRFLHKAPGHAS